MSSKVRSVIHWTTRKVPSKSCVMVAGTLHAFELSVRMKAGKDIGTAENDVLGVRGSYSSTLYLHVVRLSKTHASPQPPTSGMSGDGGAVTNCTM
jgi:hypothetical protein